MSTVEDLMSVDELPEAERVSVIVDETPALLFRVGNEYYCIEDVCTHDGQPLTDGPLIGEDIECPRHGARFNIKTGRATKMPATKGVRTFHVEAREGRIVAVLNS